MAHSLRRIELLYEYNTIASWNQDEWTRRRLNLIEDQLWGHNPPSKRSSANGRSESVRRPDRVD